MLNCIHFFKRDTIMNTDYKNLFKDKESDKKMAYKNLFDSSNKEIPNEETQKAIKELEAGSGTKFNSIDSLMADLHDVSKTKEYNTIFENSPKKELHKNITQLPQKNTDPRHKIIADIDNTVSTGTVIYWLDNFDSEITRFGNLNRVLSEDELTLAQNLNAESECVRDLFDKLKTIVQVLNPPKKQSFIGKLLSSGNENKITSTIINKVVQDIRTLMANHQVQQKYKNMPFINSEIRMIEGRIEELKKYGKCAIAACKYRIENGDPDSDMVLERVLKILQIASISESALKANNQILKNDLTTYEELRDLIIPLLYAKIQRLMTNSLDTEVLDIVSKISTI